MARNDNTMLTALSASPHNFLQPSLPLHTDTLALLKHALDPLATDVAIKQQQRQQESRKKRKRGEQVDTGDVLRLKQVHTEGFGVDQVWEQARRIIDAARAEAENAVGEAQTLAEEEDASDMDGVDGEEVYDGEDGSSLGEEGVDYEIEGEDVDGIEDGEPEGGDEDMEDALVNPDAVDDFAEEDMDVDGEGSELGDDEPAEEFVEDKHGLNDGFFSIDDFNKQSDFLEQQDFRGEDDGAASDEEDIDWDADPSAQAAVGDLAGAAAVDEPEEDDDEDGPTFGDPDAESEDDEDELDAGEMNGMGGMGNTNEVMYKDFFAPPAQKKRKNKKGRPNPHNFPAQVPTIGDGNIEDPKETEEDMERTISKVHRDLFEDESEGSDEAEDVEEQEALDPGDPRSRRSAHERRKAALQEEIRKLEAANVAKREWTLQGEARAADRPMNSLLEENLDFERAGKPVPVITAEVSESLEELIKRRILAHDFQDIIRRRPDDLATGGKDGRRGRLDYELDDTKAKKGLAEEYEEEHLRRTDSNFVDAKDEKTRKEEREIESLWRDVSAKLDSLSSWHFRPKAAAPTMEIRTDAPVINMEDARPAAGGEVAGASQLAPQEIYKAGEGAKSQGGAEVVGKSGLPEGREEMDRDDKKRRRRRAKERSRKAGTNEGANTAEGKKSEGKQGIKEGGKKEMLGDLKKGGVKVIGKKGEMQDVEGKDVRAQTGGQGASQYRL